MDKKAREIIGLPVVSMGSGSKIYDVEDMVIDPERSQVLALVVQEKTLFHSARAIPFGRINVIGRDAVVIPDGKAVIEVDRDPVLKRLYNSQIVRGLRVLTDDGRKLGEVADMLLDSKTGEIKGYYISLGRGLTVGQGSRWLPAERVTSLGQRILFAPAAVADEFEQQSGGLSGALDNAGDKLRDVGAKLNTQLEQIGTQVRQTVPQRATSLLEGRTAHDPVLDKDGNLIVDAGQQITQEHIETARSSNRLSQLALATGTGPTRQGMNSLGEQASQSLRDIPGEARDLWGQLLGNYNKTVDQADDRMTQRRIKRALGRPVTRVILDQDDNIILNTGDLITNRAVQLARESGVLDMLVDSIYVERPKLGLDDLKAPRSGEASLENRGIVPTLARPTASPTPGTTVSTTVVTPSASSIEQPAQGGPSQRG